MTLPEIHPAQELDWLHSPRGGWGYVFRVPVKVIAVRTSGLVKIAAPLSTGGERVRYVKPESLVPRKATKLECPGCGFDYLTSYDPGCCDVCRGKGPATNPDEK